MLRYAYSQSNGFDALARPIPIDLDAAAVARLRPAGFDGLAMLMLVGFDAFAMLDWMP